MNFIFKDDPKKLKALNRLRKKYLNTVKGINEEKKQVIEAFIRDAKSKSFDAGWEFHNRVMPKMASFGGKVSGESRKFKRDLIIYILKCLSENADNKFVFNYFTSMNYAVFAKHCFGSSPTKGQILGLLNNSIDWTEKNNFYSEFSRKEKFLKYLEGEFKYENIKMYVEFFELEYGNFRADVGMLNSTSKKKMQAIKDGLQEEVVD